MTTFLSDTRERGRKARRVLLGCSRALADSARHRFPQRYEALLARFRRSDAPDNSAYEGLFRYFLEGWWTYRLPSGAGARYPGLGSWSGRRVDELEAFARSAPLWGAWVRGGRPTTVERPDGSPIDLVECFVQGLKVGTDPGSDHYWGGMSGRSDQRVVEAADIALALWLYDDRAWGRLSGAERDRVMEWLSLAHQLPGLENNWHLFFILIDRVQRAFGYSGAERNVSRERFARIRAFHIGDGWFRDGPTGRADYYNAWGFHYLLHWIDRIDPEWDPQRIRQWLAQFVEGYRYLLGPHGFPILGRSVPYRVAVAAPLVLAQARGIPAAEPGEARRALDATWCHFIRNGAIRRGTVTQGYHGTDHRLLDNYSGPASSLWSLRSLVAAFAEGPESPLWQTPPTKLPVERNDYRIHLPAPQWTVRGEGSSGRITIELEENAGAEFSPLEPYTLMERIRAAAYGRPRRPQNDGAKYGRPRYSSSGPECLVGDPAHTRFHDMAAHLFPY